MPADWRAGFAALCEYVILFLHQLASFGPLPLYQFLFVSVFMEPVHLRLITVTNLFLAYFWILSYLSWSVCSLKLWRGKE